MTRGGAPFLAPVVALLLGAPVSGPWGTPPLSAPPPASPPFHTEVASADTVRLSLDAALERFLTTSPALTAARFREAGAQAAVRQAAAFANPHLNLLAENLGAREATSGLPGWSGIHGTLLLSLPISWGGQRGRFRETVAAEARYESALSAREGVTRSVGLAQLVVDAEAVRSHLAAARGEVTALSEWVRILDARVTEGDAASGEAARARLEQARAVGRLARVEGEAARNSALLALHLGLAPEAVVEVTLPDRCTSGGLVGLPDLHSGLPGTGGPLSGPLAPFEARLAVEEARARLTRTSRFPPLLPQVGWRREMGQNALTLGFGVDLPVLDRRSSAMEEARQQAQAAAMELEAARSEVDAARESQLGRIRALEAAGRVFDSAWREAAELAVSSMEAAYGEGEVTLEALLQARRARWEALESLADWKREFRSAQLALLELEGRLPAAASLCVMAPFEGGE